MKTDKDAERVRQFVSEAIRQDNAEKFAAKLERIEQTTRECRTELTAGLKKVGDLDTKTTTIREEQVGEKARLTAVADRVTKTEGLIETHATKIGSVTSKSDSNELMWKERPTTGAVFLIVFGVVGLVGTIVSLAVNAGKVGDPSQMRDQRGAEIEKIDPAGGASPATTASATGLPPAGPSAAPS